MTTQAQMNRIETGAALTHAAHNGGPLPEGWTEYKSEQIKGFVKIGVRTQLI